MANLSTENIGTNYKGILNLGSTINTPLSTTLQNITDGDGNASPLKISTLRIALGVATGTGLLNFPDAGTTASDGIQFGAGTTNLYRNTSTTLKTDGNLNVTGIIYANGELANSLTGVIKNGQSTLIVGNTLTGSSVTSALSIAQTWNTTGNPTLLFANVTNTASGASSNLFDFQVGGISQGKLTKAGDLQVISISNLSTFNLSSGGIIGFGTRSKINSPSNGLIILTANDGTTLSAIESLYERYGSGTPEGVVTAPIGAIYHRVDGGAGTSFYVKESGTGNTGWVAK